MSKSKFIPAIMIAAAFGLASCSTLTQAPKTVASEALLAGNYTLDADHAALTFTISHFGISDYLGRFNTIDAALDFDADNPQAARLTATAQIDSLDVNNPEFEQTLIGESWFDAAAHPQATLILDQITQTGPSSATAAGQITLKGITQPIIWDVAFLGGARNPLTQTYTIGFDASAKIKRSDFGIDAFMSIAGDKFDFDTVTLRFNGEFQKQ